MMNVTLNWKKLLPRAVYYFHIAYSKYLHFPIAYLGFISLIYSAMIQQFPVTVQAFPDLLRFLIVTSIVVPLTGVLIGWMHFRGYLRFLFKAEMDVHAESNPYTSEIVVPVELPTLKAISALCKYHGIEVPDLDKIIMQTEKRG